jgi:hypothetical protein
MTRARSRRSPALLSVLGLAAFAQAGCSSTFIGLETPDGGVSSNSGSTGTGTGTGTTSVSGTISGSGSASTSSTSSCCPANFDLYSCTFPDGGAGLACHNPALGCASSQTCGVGCDPVVTGTCGAGSDGGPAGLQWWYTCGDPVCRVTDPDAGSLVDDAGTPCPAAGTSCAASGETCGTHNSSINCGATLVCSATDPTKTQFGCPISSRRFKSDVHYVDDAELEMLRDEALHIRLATYNYKPQFGDPDARHLGFIIEDDPQSPAVDHGRDRVDLYGYVSMVVATMQLQQREIADLRRQLDEARAGTCETPPARSR